MPHNVLYNKFKENDYGTNIFSISIYYDTINDALA